MKDVIDAHAHRRINRLSEFIINDVVKSNKMWILQIRINTIHNWETLVIGTASILSLVLSITALIVALAK